jgi:hypothetical protein
MKTCTKCLKARSESEFNYKNRVKGALHAHCKDCSRAAVREHYARNKTYYTNKARSRNRAVKEELRRRLLSYFSTHPCVDCGEHDPVVLDFDHDEIEDKFASISDMLKHRRSWSSIHSEITKCSVRCANCHRRRTAAQFGWYKL